MLLALLVLWQQTVCSDKIVGALISLLMFKVVIPQVRMVENLRYTLLMMYTQPMILLYTVSDIGSVAFDPALGHAKKRKLMMQSYVV